MKEQIAHLISIQNDYIVKQSDDELLLIKLKNNVADFNQYLVLNEVGAFIWLRLSPTDDLKSICEKTSSEFECTPNEIEGEVAEFLKKLHQFTIN